MAKPEPQRICRFLHMAAICLLLPVTHSYSILGVFPTKAVSHFRIGLALMQGLVDAGHNVTMISPFLVKTSSTNRSKGQLHVVYVADQPFFTGKDQHIDSMHHNPISTAFKLLHEGIGSTRHTLKSSAVQSLLSLRPQFDVVIIEAFLNDALLCLGDHFNAPIISMSPFGSTKLTNDMVGSPAPISYVPHVTLPLTDRMSMPQRMLNTLTTMAEYFFVNLIYLPAHQKLCREIFGNSVLSLSAMQTNVSLVLLNIHFTLNYPRPYMRNMIEVGGLHINRNDHSRLPSRVQRFMDEAPDGVIYFSMGSSIRCSEMSADKLEMLRRVFRSLSQRVLWKCDIEPEISDNPSSNMLVMKWFAQEKVLAHPNVRIFITHGGLLSSIEAVYFAVPMIGVPIFGDQHLNVAKAVAAGFGLQIRFDNLTESSLRWSIGEIINKEHYQSRMHQTSRLYRDQQNHPLDTAIYWVEYVARHQGAPHLQSSGRLLSFWAIHNIDVYAVFVLVLVFTVWFLLQFCLYRNLMHILSTFYIMHPLKIERKMGNYYFKNKRQ